MIASSASYSLTVLFRLARLFRVAYALPLAVLGVLLHPSLVLDAQNGAQPPIRVELSSAPLLRLPGAVDSNSPAVWEQVDGWNLLFVMTSINGQPSTASGRAFSSLGQPRVATVEPWPGGGVWMEAIVKDDDGTWYGYYHNENRANMCRGTDKVIPRIGAARSRDLGATWEPLGVILEAPPRTYDCTTDNEYFVGGVGDFSVQLDARSQDLYFFYSLYLREASAQGVGVARLAWADRDDPSGTDHGLAKPLLAARGQRGQNARGVGLPCRLPALSDDTAMARRQPRRECVLGPVRALEHSSVPVRDAAEPR